MLWLTLAATMSGATPLPPIVADFQSICGYRDQALPGLQLTQPALVPERLQHPVHELRLRHERLQARLRAARLRRQLRIPREDLHVELDLVPGDLIDVLGERKLDEDPAHGIIGVQLLDQRDEILLRRARGQRVIPDLDPDLCASLPLAVEIPAPQRVTSPKVAPVSLLPALPSGETVDGPPTGVATSDGDDVEDPDEARHAEE